MQRKIRIGHIGTKHDHSPGKLECVLKFPDIYEVIGIVEEDEQQRLSVQNTPPYQGIPFISMEQMIDARPDCILVEGFEYDLPHVALECVRNDIAVHIDKPAGIDLQAFTETLRIAKSKSLPVQMAYMYRYNPAIQECLHFIRDGRLGEVHSVTAIMNTGHETDKRQWLSNFEQGGIMFFLGCHMVDLIHLMQGTPDAITPYLSASRIEGTTSIDQATALLHYKTGLSIAQANACEINGYGRRQLVVCGTKGTYEILPLENPTIVRFTNASEAYSYGNRASLLPIRSLERDERYDEMMLQFAAMVRGEIENPFSYEYELQTQRMLLACCGYDVDYHSPIEL